MWRDNMGKYERNNAGDSSDNQQFYKQVFSFYTQAGSVCSGIRMGLSRGLISDPGPLHISWTRYPIMLTGLGLMEEGGLGRGERTFLSNSYFLW